jgi:CRP/FNR family transcriptional regulator, cyclic AMP receptor protein
LGVELLGWLAAGFTLLAFSMRTMLPLRVAAITSNVFFISYAALVGVNPVLVLHLILLPFNIWRLAEILRTRRSVARARRGALDPAALRGLSTARKSYPAGAVVFEKGDAPDYIYFVLSGRVGLDHVEVELGPGEVFGEIAFFTDARARTLTARCIEPCELLALDEAAFTRLHYQDPSFGLYLMRLITQRLMDGMGRVPNPYFDRNG